MVTVIVPVYNAEKTLSACLQSILEQTYRNFELLLIDDGSKDRSGELCDGLREACEKQGVHCRVIHKENGGASSARNCGIEQAKGEYFVCIDSDDIIEPCYLMDLVRTAEEHPEFGHVLCGFKCTSHVHDYIMTDKEPLSVLDRKDYMRLTDKILIQSPCLALYRTEIVRKNNVRMREDMSRGEDILFNLDYLDALDRTAIGVVNKVNYIYQNEDPDSLYRKYREDLLNIIETINDAIAGKLEKWGVTDETSRKLYYDSVFSGYESVFRNTLLRQNPMSKRERLAFNSAVLKSEGFREALKFSTVPILPALRHAYESGDYGKVLAVDRLQKLKRVIRGIISK